MTNTGVNTGESSRVTKRWRSNEISTIHEMLSAGDANTQLIDELKLIPEEEKESIMKQLNFTIYVPPEENLAMKADLCLPWRKLRLMKR